ncbi:unnamed protein product, partial [Mesorhabditis spiculigera]
MVDLASSPQGPFHRQHICPCNVPFDFRPIRIHVYRNGDERNSSRVVHVTRRYFRHWIVFLDQLTKILKTTTAVNKLYTIDGRQISHFEDLEPDGEYVAVERGPFIPCNYGTLAEKLRNRNTRFIVPGASRNGHNGEHFLNGAEGVDIYLKQHGYGSCTGLPYPFDGFEKSPSCSYIHSMANGEDELMVPVPNQPSWRQTSSEASKHAQIQEESDSNAVVIKISVPQLQTNATTARKASLSPLQIEEGQIRPASRSAGTQTTEKETQSPMEQESENVSKREKPGFEADAPAARTLKKDLSIDLDYQKEAENPKIPQKLEPAKGATWFTEDFDDPDVDVLCLPPIGIRPGKLAERGELLLYETERIRRSRTTHNLGYPSLRNLNAASFDPDFDNI